MRTVILGALCGLLPASGWAQQAASQDVVYVGAQTIEAGPSMVGDLTALWQHVESSNVLVDIGATTGRDGERDWWQGHGGVALRRHLTNVRLAADAGWAPNGGGAPPSPYQKWSGSVDRGIGGPATGVRVEAMSVHIAAVQVSVMGAGAYVTKAPVTVRVTGYAMRTGGQTAPAANGRVDWVRGRWTWMAGGTASGRVASLSSTVDPLLRSTRGAFAGGRIRLGSRTLLATCERTVHSGVFTTAVAVGLQVPVR